MTKSRRVFLSHTSELREYPDGLSFVGAAEAAVLSAEHLPVDMKYFTARDGKPADYCRERVRSAGIYVGIIGFRYGSPIPDLPHLSYTELEFEEAGAAGLERLVFLLDEEADVRLPYVAIRDEYAERQEKFRKRLCDSGITVQKVQDPRQLEARLLQALLSRPSDEAPAVAVPTASNPLRTPDSLDARAWQRLWELLHRVAPTAWCEEAYQWSYVVDGEAGRAAAPFTTPTGDLYRWALDLDAREQSADGLPKVIAFAHALGAGFSKSRGAERRRRGSALNSWVRETRERFGLPEPLPVPDITTPQMTMLVRLDQDPQESGHVSAEVWLRPPAGSSEWRRVQPPESATDRIKVTVDGARILVERCLRTFRVEAEAFLRRGGADWEQPPKLQRIEFAVTDTLLETEFDQWLCEVTVYKPRMLGEQYEVVVRCPDARDLADSAHLWSSRWAWLDHRGGRDDKATFWIRNEDLDRLDDHVADWEESEHPACVAIAADDAEPAWRAALHVGMPVVVWQRAHRSQHEPAPGLKDLLPIEDVSDLPQAVRLLRRDTGLARSARSSVILLWDDPDHSLETAPLTDVSFVF
ncbi:DUF4062 domain-containing protein [Streptomyces sp. NPDC052036]|uniref:VMAP-C domain-containing protein n=1 Tax=Streptomyces sp. NPDC052036 TaxID=3155171 RepID=UPI00343BEAD7